MDSEAGARYHRWSFGKSLQRADLRAAYVMKGAATAARPTEGRDGIDARVPVHGRRPAVHVLCGGAQMTSPPKAGGELVLEWQFSGIPCTGRFVPAAGVFVLQFLLKVITQRRPRLQVLI